MAAVLHALLPSTNVQLRGQDVVKLRWEAPSTPAGSGMHANVVCRARRASTAYVETTGETVPTAVPIDGWSEVWV
ncbi:uncharacterized protein B0I36DRAFT_313903 [Microdochium trichocladiopsis]|uniref:Uncharacterized protein n=1 Tax=Microdochium trichocladiopsis TaxID=1682393 RepID=A0A9P8YDQ7_9PEZI|nr:uncharacterized protein B0I36DRAFT_313903 [Microdochium trichocladiopsis]KAH7037369.1 hypothetical protein B0I36DRAFT_313903 [Microdochium trichocladiopsis]